MNETNQTPIVETPAYSVESCRKTTPSNAYRRKTAYQSTRSNIFADVKAAVTTRQMAEHYGLRPDRHGMVCCPFHGDKHPSMKVDARFHCFACGADGDVIDFVARLRGVRNIEAAREIAGVVGLLGSPLGGAGTRSVTERARTLTKSSRATGSPSPSAAQTPLPKGEARPTRCSLELDDLQNYLAAMRQNKTRYAPKNPEEPLHQKFCEALHGEAQAEQLLAELARMSPREQRMWKMSHPEEVKRIERANEQKL